MQGLLSKGAHWATGHSRAAGSKRQAAPPSVQAAVGGCQCCVEPSTSSHMTVTAPMRPCMPSRMHRMAVAMHAKRGSSQAASAPSDSGSEAGTKKRGLPPSKPSDDSSAQKLVEPEDFLEDDDVMLADQELEENFGEDELEGDDYIEDEDEEAPLDVVLPGDDGEDDEYEEEDNKVLPVPGQVEYETVDFDVVMKRLSDAQKGATPARVELVPQETILAQEREAEEARQAALALPAGAQLDVNRQGYQAFLMDAIEFLVAETSDGRLDLRDSYVYDKAGNHYMRPTTSGQLPSQPALLQILPWVERRSDDSLKNKPGLAKLKKVYFVGVSSTEPYRIAMDQVYVFDGYSRTLTRPPVRMTHPKIREPVLRIRADGVTIEEGSQMMHPALVGINHDPLAWMTPEEREAQLQARLEELEAQAEEVDELDEQPDVPSTDMM